MNEEYMNKIRNLSNIAWKKYKEWGLTKPALRDDKFWDKVTKEINELVKTEEDFETRQFFTDILNVYAGELDRERDMMCKQEKLNL